MLGGECHLRDREVAQLAFDKGYERGKADMLDIPGVELAKGYNDEAKEYNEKYPDHSPMVDSFGDIPGVREAMEEYLLGNALITITDIPESVAPGPVAPLALNNDFVQAAIAKGKGEQW